MSKVISIRLGDTEQLFLEKVAAEKQLTVTQAARHFFLQNLALDSIKTEVQDVVQNAMIDVIAQLQMLQQQLDEVGLQTITKDDLAKATNHILSQLKK